MSLRLSPTSISQSILLSPFFLPKRYSGHSRWSKIKHEKGAADAVKGQTISRIIKDISASVHRDGPDPSKNIRLETIISLAKKENIPKATIDAAIKRGSGSESVSGKPSTPLLYSSFGPAGVALIIEALTDNKTRVVALLKSILKKHNSSLSSSALFNFQQKGRLLINSHHSFDHVFQHALDYGAEDVEQLQDAVQIITQPSQTTLTANSLKQLGHTILEADLAWIPNSKVSLDPLSPDGLTLTSLIKALQDEPDIVKVYHNAL